MPKHAWLGLTLISIASAGAHAQCDAGWLPGMGRAIQNLGTFRTGAIFDPDGPGPLSPELVVGGDFDDSVGFQDPPAMSGLARWNGIEWRPFPFVFFNTLNTWPASMCVHDLDGDGPGPARLIVGGFFLHVPDVFATDGNEILPLGGSPDGQVNVVASLDPDDDGPLAPELYAGGHFTSDGATLLPGGIARWRSGAWEPVGAGFEGWTTALVQADLDGSGPMPSMLIAGGMITIGGVTSAVAAFDGTNWFHVGQAVDPAPSSFAMHDFDGDGPDPARLVAVGSLNSFETPDTLQGNVYFDGAEWRRIAPLDSLNHWSIASFDLDGPGGAPARLFLGGDVRLPGESTTRPVVELVNGAWAALSDDLTGRVEGLQQVVLPGQKQPVLLLLGSAASPSTALDVSVFDGQTLRPLTNGFDRQVRDLAAARVGGAAGVVAIGDFYAAPGVPAEKVAFFDGHDWSSLGFNSIGGQLRTVLAYDPDGAGPREDVIVVSGPFNRVNGTPAANVAQFDGTSWAPMGAGLPAYAIQMVVFDEDGPGPEQPVIVAAPGVQASTTGAPIRLKQWDGSAWSDFGLNFISESTRARFSALTTLDLDGPGPLPRELIVAGVFDRVGVTEVPGIVAYDGEVWRPLPTTNIASYGLFAWDRHADGREVLVSPGRFDTPQGQVFTTGVWDGADAWTLLGSGFVSPFNAPTAPGQYIAVPSRGGASTLYAAGWFIHADGRDASGIARWNGFEWEPLGAGISLNGVVNVTHDGPRAMAVLHPGASDEPIICIAGDFQVAGGAPGAYFATYAAGSCCPADHNRDGRVNTQDFFDFLTAFFAEAPAADFNDDSIVNSQDFFDFLGAFFSACD